LETLILLASRAIELFERPIDEQKRQLITIVFLNLSLNGNPGSSLKNSKVWRYCFCGDWFLFRRCGLSRSWDGFRLASRLGP
jgi:hypothetical protein